MINNVPLFDHDTAEASGSATLKLMRTSLLVGLFALTGCASVLNIGESDYSCSGMPEDGLRCMSARESYDLTNDDYVPRSMHRKEGPNTDEIDAQAIQQQRQQQFVNDYVAPYMPDKPIPIRTPAQVMRIWIAPWEDKNDDLITTGYVHTEIEARRWVIGDTPAPTAPSLQPLKVY